jgi:hypothetical protein
VWSAGVEKRADERRNGEAEWFQRRGAGIVKVSHTEIIDHESDTPRAFRCTLFHPLASLPCARCLSYLTARV